METHVGHGSQPFCPPLKLDLAAQRAWLGPQELDLTAREFAVLGHLVRHPGALVTTSELLSAIWGSDDVIGDTALRTVIKRLRRKLGDDPRQPRYIITVWGRGYRFQQPATPPPKQ